MKKVYVDRDYILNEIVNRALASAVFDGDTQIIFDGENFRYELLDKSFPLGYIIEHSQYINCAMEEKSKDSSLNDFQYWLATQLYIHANAMHDYFRTKEKILIVDK